MNKARMEQLDIALTVWREWIDYVIKEENK